MEFTIIQEGLVPLTEVEMQRLVDVVDNFFVDDAGGRRMMRFSHLSDDVNAHAHRAGWKSIIGRIPTQLEIMAACCTLERRGVIQTEFIGGILHFAAVPCN